jgi:hypothetical protein
MTSRKASSSKASSSKAKQPAAKQSKQQQSKQAAAKQASSSKASKQQQSKTHTDPIDNPAAAAADHAAAATSLPSFVLLLFVCYGGLSSNHFSVGADPIDKPAVAAAAEADMTDHVGTTDHETDHAVKTNHAAAPPPLFVPLPFYFTRSPGGSDLFGVW